LAQLKEPPKMVVAPGSADQSEPSVGGGQHGHGDLDDDLFGQERGFVHHDVGGLVASQASAHVARPGGNPMRAELESRVGRAPDFGTVAAPLVVKQPLEQLVEPVEQQSRLVLRGCQEDVPRGTGPKEGGQD
jgi:hypothetical protein